jgi:two-component system NtrC family sensor kinase
MKKILIVDDNSDNLYMLESLLKSHGMEVTSAHNGKDALEKAHANPPDLIVADILMPVMDGYTLCKKWKTDKKLKNIPFIFYTATYTDPKDEKFALSLGAERFIIKPQEPETLINILKDVIDKELVIKSSATRPLGTEMEFFRQYNDVLFRKLEKKMLDLSLANQKLEREIAEHSKTGEKLLRLAQAIEESPIYIILTDLQGNIEYVNPKFTQVTGYSEEEVIGKNPRLLKSEEMSPEVYEDLWHKITQGNVWQGELCNKKKNGELYWEYGTISPVRNARGVITNFMAIKEDVSERRKLEDQLRQSQKLEGIGQLAGGVAHDFNNILTAIIGYAHLALLKMSDDDPLRHYLHQILESSEKATVLTQSLLAFSRKQTVHLTSIDLNKLIRDFQKFLQRILQEDIELKTICTDNALPVMVDRGQIEQILMNLVTNARDAMPKGGSLTIETGLLEWDEEFVKFHGYGEPGKYAIISATDTGIGMDEKTSEKIFEPFFTTKEQGKGTGLGLAMVYGIVKKHNGHINVYSELGKGTTFKIFLPLSGAIAGDEEKPKQPAAALIKGGTETILVAEDNEEIRILISAILTNYGYNIIIAADGEEAILKFAKNKNKIDLAIIDGIMPKKSGKEVFKEIKIIKSKIKAIILSGYTEDMLNFSEIADENVVFIQKPVLPSDILKKVREILDR